MGLRRLRRLAVLASGAVLLVAALMAAGVARSPSGEARDEATAAYSIDAAPGTALRTQRLARTTINWRGGPITTSTGETVDVRVSDTLPVETTPESWAEFLTGLTHGSEVTSLKTYIATLDEVQELCGARALGCYSANQMMAMGDSTVPETTPEEVVRHEYGHHVAFHRLNTPWLAIDWGPKYWATSATVCSRVLRREAFPGDQGNNYSQNPGEAWAETYRLLDEQKAGVTTATWPIIAPSFFPNEAAFVAAERDVLEPWTGGQKAVFTRTFRKARRRVWWIPVPTPLDGDLRVSVTVPKNGLHQVALMAADRVTVIDRAQWVTQRVQRLTSRVCGQRQLLVRVTRAGAPGRITVSVSTP